MNGGALAAALLMSLGLIAAILGVAKVSLAVVVAGLVVVTVGVIVGVVSGRRYERERRR